MKEFLWKVRGKIDYLKRAISLYYWCPSLDKGHVDVPFTFREVSSIEDLKYINFTYKEDDYHNRFLSGHIFYFWAYSGQPVSYGWVNPTGKHILGELALEMKLESEMEVLYDFHTFEDYRGKGLYPALLQKICDRNSRSKLIYVFPANTGSVRGIRKANFQFIGNIYGYNKHRYSSLIKRHGKNNF